MNYALEIILGLCVMSLITRSFFFFSKEEYELPDLLQRSLRYAPLAALAAVIGPEIFLEHGEILPTWHQPKLYAAVAATAYFLWRRGLLGTIVTGTAVLIALKLGLGW